MENWTLFSLRCLSLTGASLLCLTILRPRYPRVATGLLQVTGLVLLCWFFRGMGSRAFGALQAVALLAATLALYRESWSVKVFATFSTLIFSGGGCLGGWLLSRCLHVAPWGWPLATLVGGTLCCLMALWLYRRWSGGLFEELGERRWRMLGVQPLLAYAFAIALSPEDGAAIGYRELCYYALLILCFCYIYFFIFHEAASERARRLLMEQHRRMEENLSYYGRCYEALRQQVDHAYRLAHDMKKHCAVIGGLLARQAYDEAGAYCQELSGRLETRPDLQPLCANRVVDVLLHQARDRALDHKVRFCCTASVPQEVDIRPFDLCAIYGNCLDNALEACALCADAFLEVETYCKMGYLVLRVRNSHANVLPPPGARLKSAKGREERHGLGLTIMEDICKRYDGECRHSYDDKTFQVEVILSLCHRAQP